MAKSLNWTVEEDNILKRYYSDIGVEGCIKLVSRSSKAINVRASRLGLKLNNAWNKKLTTEEYRNKLLSLGIRNIDIIEEYINDATEVLHKCIVCNNSWSVRPNNILNGSGCPKCNKGFGWLSSASNSAKSCIYLVEMGVDSKKVLKLGVTTSIRKRISAIRQHSDSEPKVLLRVHTSSEVVLQAEQLLLRYFSGYKVDSVNPFPGHTELLDISCREELISMLYDIFYEEDVFE